MNTTKLRLFKKDFTLMLIGQIISLFGNTILRFILPLYILNVSGSPVLFGIVSATSIIPMIIMSPLGGIIADRVNKQKIMVVLDFMTTGILLLFMLANGRVLLVPLVVIMLMLLYAVQGAYQPAVQASVPLLAKGELLMPANSAINLVQSMSNLLGPVIGGMLYAVYGLNIILVVSSVCFFISAVMELFIQIPYKKQAKRETVWKTVQNDMRISIRFMVKENSVIIKILFLLICVNLFMSAMLVIGLPVVITQNLGFNETYYGITQGCMGAGGLAGGLFAGFLGNKLSVHKSHILLLLCGLGIIPMGLVLMADVSAFICFLAISIMSFFIMALSTIFSIKMLAFVQEHTPPHILGKVVSCIMALAMLSMPLGQAIYGLLFQQLQSVVWSVFLGSAILSCLTAMFSKASFQRLSEMQPIKSEENNG